MPEYRFGEEGNLRLSQVGSGTIYPTAQFTAVDISETAELLETTAGNDTWRTFRSGLKGWEGSLKLFNNGTESPLGTADIATLAGGGTFVLYVSPFGTASGKARHWGTIVVESRGLMYPFDKLAEVELSFRGHGALADDTW